MMRKHMIVVAFGALCALFLTACSGAAVPAAGGSVQVPDRIQVENTDTQVITVNAKEEVKVVPDMAQVIYGVTTQHADAAKCQEDNAEKMNQLIATLKELGIEEKSIQTSNYDLNPRQDWNNNGEIIGYEMTAQVTVSDIPLDQIGEILSKSVSAGVNQVQSVTYLSSEYDASYQEALTKAVAAAQEKAQALADASGSTLGHAVRITEYSDNQAARYQNVMRSSVKLDEAMGAGAAMMPGEISVEANISVEFAIQ